MQYIFLKRQHLLSLVNKNFYNFLHPVIKFFTSASAPKRNMLIVIICKSNIIFMGTFNTHLTKEEEIKIIQFYNRTISRIKN